MKDENDNKTIDFIKNDNDEYNDYWLSREYVRASTIMNVLRISMIESISKKDLTVLYYALDLAKYDNSNNEVIYFDVDKKLISEESGIALPNVHRSIKKLNKILVKQENGLYKLNVY